MEPFEHLSRAISKNLTSNLDPLTLEAGETLFRQGEAGDTVYVVANGQLSVTITQDDGSKTNAGAIGPGELAGDIHILREGKRTSTVRAVTRCELFKLSISSFENLEPESLKELQKIIRHRLRRNQLAVILHDLFGFMGEGLLSKVEHLLEWVHVKRGDILYRQGERSDSLYIIVSGRLQRVSEDGEAPPRVVGEAGRGEVVGALSLFTGNGRTVTIRSIRDTELVRVSRDSFEKLIDERPQLMMTVTRLLVRHMQESAPPMRLKKRELGIAVLAAGQNLDIRAFSERLSKALSGFSTTLHLNSSRLDHMLQIEGIAESCEEDPYGLNLSVWLDEQEARHRYVVYEADTGWTNWTKRCLQRADHILIVAGPGDDPGQNGSGKFFPELSNGAGSVKKTLVLLHPDKSRFPFGTGRFLDQLKIHYINHMAGEADSEYQKLARKLTGNGYGLVLSGGGANAFSHIGVIRALKEAGVPIDMIGGTSMGAVIASQYAMGLDWEEIVQVNRKIWIDAKPTSDFTLPLISLLSCRKFDTVSKLCYGETTIEDLWEEFFCISTNLSTARPVVHRKGSLWRAVRASCALPGITPPLVEGRDLLVDGAVLNNLPVDVMRQIRDCFVIAVDASENDGFRVDREMAPSPWDVLRGYFYQPEGSSRFPNLLEIITRTTLVGSIHKTQAAMADSDFYLRPPLKGFNLMDLSDLDKIVSIGYEYAKEKIDQWKESGSFKNFL